jgi:drug/metabolite transporter (DMT)-like permease
MFICAAAFICSLQVVLVPIVLGLFGKQVTKNVWIAAFLAVLGVGLLELGDATSVGLSIGDLWCLGQPIGELCMNNLTRELALTIYCMLLDKASVLRTS